MPQQMKYHSHNHNHGPSRKTFGSVVQNALSLSASNDKSIASIIKRLSELLPGNVILPVERFVGKELLYFRSTVPLTADERDRLRARARDFKREIRCSRVLILTMKDKSTLSLVEGKEIVMQSPLREHLTRIELIAVNPKKFDARPAPRQAGQPMVHVYVQFASEEEAAAQVNTVDAMPYKQWFVHSPQCDEHSVFYPNDNYAFHDHVWMNPEYKGPSGLQQREAAGDAPDVDAGYYAALQNSMSGQAARSPMRLHPRPSSNSMVSVRSSTPRSHRDSSSDDGDDTTTLLSLTSSLRTLPLIPATPNTPGHLLLPVTPSVKPLVLDPLLTPTTEDISATPTEYDADAFCSFFC